MVVGRWFTYWTAMEAIEVIEADGLRVVEVEDLGTFTCDHERVDREKASRR